jgi:hypothetical protein
MMLVDVRWSGRDAGLVDAMKCEKVNNDRWFIVDMMSLMMSVDEKTG